MPSIIDNVKSDVSLAWTIVSKMQIPTDAFEKVGKRYNHQVLNVHMAFPLNVMAKGFG